jgi:hypothetical protein
MCVDCNKSHISYLHNFRLLVQLPELDDQGRRVYFLRGGLNDPNVIEQTEFNKVFGRKKLCVWTVFVSKFWSVLSKGVFDDGRLHHARG